MPCSSWYASRWVCGLLLGNYFFFSLTKINFKEWTNEDHDNPNKVVENNVRISKPKCGGAPSCIDVTDVVRCTRWTHRLASSSSVVRYLPSCMKKGKTPSGRKTFHTTLWYSDGFLHVQRWPVDSLVSSSKNCNDLMPSQSGTLTRLIKWRSQTLLHQRKMTSPYPS